MKLFQTLNKSAVALAGLFCFCAMAAYSQQPSSRVQSRARAANTATGEKIFTTNCVGCHGLDGTGSQRAPNIVSNPQVQKLSAEDMRRIVSEGVPGTGMPAFKRLGLPAIRSTVAYVRSLQGKTASAALPGDPKRGEAIFFGSAECSNCHMVSGRGGFMGPDLATYGQRHSADAIKSAVTNPSSRDHVQGTVTATTTSGVTFAGIIRNEDNFSLQLQSADGSFHSISKAEVKNIERSQTPLMPANYGSKLSSAQLDDVVSYLLKIAQSSTQPDTRHPEEE